MAKQRLQRRADSRALSTEPAPGAAPGTLVMRSEEPPTIVLIDYDADVVAEKALASVEQCVPYLTDDRPSITWVDVRGIGNAEIFVRLGEIFNIHPLALEDVVNVPQRPKTDVFPDQQLIISRMVQISDSGDLRTEQIAILFGKGFVLTVQEEASADVLEPVRERIRKGKGVIRKLGADYLAYAILDAIIDGFYPVLETYGERIETLELETTNPPQGMSRSIHDLKRELLTIRRGLWPQREIVSSLLRDESIHIGRETQLYLRDTYDHAVQLMDIVETYREIASGLMDLYLSSVSNRMNEVMKFLTMISTIFLPITFIAGLYGMNFDTSASSYNMPELRWRYGYPFSIGLMVTSLVVLLVYYVKRGWLGGPRRPH